MKIALLLVLLVGNAAFAADKLDVVAFIRKADTLILLSIFPQQVYETDEHGNPTEKDRKKERIHGFPVFGKIAATDITTRESIKDALIGTLASVKEGPPLLCFLPRHAVCLKQGDSHIDLLICFECLQAKVRYLDIQETGEVTVKEEFVSIGVAGRDVLDRLLDSRGIKRDIPKKEAEPDQPLQLESPAKHSR